MTFAQSFLAAIVSQSSQELTALKPLCDNGLVMVDILAAPIDGSNSGVAAIRSPLSSMRGFVLMIAMTTMFLIRRR
jgi:hypothetical protein